MRRYGTAPKNIDDAVGDYRMDEHIGDVVGHVFVEPKDDLGRRVELARFRLG
jgi:hypothetical protein